VLEKPELLAREPSAAGAESEAEVEAYFKETGLSPVLRYDGSSLPAGTTIAGPAILREPTTTVVVYPGSTVVVTELGNYLLELAPDATDSRPMQEEALA
jgi:N-methylhydantoinase A